MHSPHWHGLTCWDVHFHLRSEEDIFLSGNPAKAAGVLGVAVVTGFILSERVQHSPIAWREMSSSFYVLYATQILRLEITVVGLFISAYTIGSLVGTLLLGRIADRYGSARTIQVGLLFVLIAPLVAQGFTLMKNLPDWMAYAFALIYVCIGLIENLMILGYMNYALDLAPAGGSAEFIWALSMPLGALAYWGPRWQAGCSV